MLVGIHIDQYGKFCKFLERYEQILDFNRIDHVRLNSSDLDFWDKVKELDVFIFRWQHHDWDRQLAGTILPIIEKELHIKCFPDQSTAWHYDDKIKQYFLLKQYGHPIIQSWIFWDKENAINWAKISEYPVVFKLTRGAGSSNVILVNNKKRAIKLIERMFGKGFNNDKLNSIGATKWVDFNLYKYLHHFAGNLLRKYRGEDSSNLWLKQKNYILFQKFFPDNSFDTRVTVIGNRIFAFRRFNRENDFRSSGSGKINFDKDQIDKNLLRIAYEVSKSMNFQSMSYDFLYDKEKKPGFCEISYTFSDKAIYQCSGYWDKELNWHDGHYWPQYFQLIDLLNITDLKQPEIFI